MTNFSASAASTPATNSLYVIDEEGDPVCRHCQGSYNFGHFQSCKYWADFRSSREATELKMLRDRLQRYVKNETPKTGETP